MRIRRARSGEYDEIGEVTLTAYAPFVHGDDDPYRDRLRDTATRDSEAEVWVAVDDGSVLGNVAGGIMGSITLCPAGSPWRELATADEGEFRMLAVSPSAQGRGVGRALATWAVDRFRVEGARAVVLSSLPAMVGAHRLYDRLGFTRAPDRDWWPEEHVALWAFELGLQPARRLDETP